MWRTVTLEDGIQESEIRIPELQELLVAGDPSAHGRLRIGVRK
jgi:hypothetical protein